MKTFFLACKRDLVRGINSGGSLSMQNMVLCANKVTQNADNRFTEEANFLVNNCVGKSSFPAEVG